MKLTLTTSKLAKRKKIKQNENNFFSNHSHLGIMSDGSSFLTYANYVALALGTLATAHFVFSRSSKDREAYEDMDHLALNCRRPETEWLNMGSWEVS